MKFSLKICGGVLDKTHRPSSKICSSCNVVKLTLELNERVYKCECGLSIDRDLNASYNILSEGKKLLTY